MDLSEIVKRSYKNCHAIGLHSIVFDQKPDGRLRRMFYTDSSHVLWKNNNVFSSDLSIALHSHHRAIEIHVVKGTVYNITALASFPNNEEDGNTVRWKFQSHIKTNKGRFDVMGNYILSDIKNQKLDVGDTCSMKASDIHTVFVEPGLEAAWIITEGDSDPEYNSICYSNYDLTQFRFEDHYKPITEQEVSVMLELVAKD